MNLPSDENASPLPVPIQEGLAAARANILPAILLQAVALAIVLGYYLHPPTQAWMNRLEAIRLHYGLLYGAISTPIFAAVIPLLLQSLQRGNRTKATLRQLPFLIGLWSIKGVEVDLFYRMQAWLFGDAADFRTIAMKVFIDQAVYVLLWAAPTTIVLYAFKDAGYNWSRTKQLLGPNWVRTRMVPVTLSNWAVWVPAVAIIYCLPTPLQLPLQNIVLCLWILIFMFLIGKEQPSADILLDETS